MFETVAVAYYYVAGTGLFKLVAISSKFKIYLNLSGVLGFWGAIRN